MNASGALTVTYNDAPPQAVIRIAGALAAGDLNEVVRLSAREPRLPAGTVVLIEYAEPSAFDAEAGGVLLHLMEELLSADPKAVLIVNPALLDIEAVGTRRLRQRALDDERVHFFDTRAEADAFVEALGAPPDHAGEAQRVAHGK